MLHAHQSLKLAVQLIIHLPDQAVFHVTDTVAQWSLFDSKATLLRSGCDLLANIPHVDHVIATVPASRIVFIETPLPKVSAAKREALLRYAIEDKLTIDPDTVHVVLLGLADGSANGIAASDSTLTRHIVAAIDRRWFSDALAWLTASRLAPRAVFAETERITAAAHEWAIVLGQHQCVAKRHDGFAYSLDSDTSHAATTMPPFALTLALREVPTPPLQLAIYTMDNLALNSVELDTIASMATTWQQALNIPTRMAGMITSQTDARLLQLNATQRKTGNLLTGEFTPRSAGSGWLQRLRPVLLLAMAMLGLQLLFNIADAWRLDRQRLAIEAEMRQLFQTTFPKATAIVDPALQLQRNVETLKRERGLSIPGDPRPALAQLTDLSKAAPSLVIGAITINEDTTILSGTIDHEAAEKSLRQKILTMPQATLKMEPSKAGEPKQIKQPKQITITIANKAGST